jgi:hypothetical protein
VPTAKHKKSKKPARAKPRAKSGAPSLLTCEIVYDEVDADDADVREAVKRLKRGDRAILRAAERYVVQYCEDAIAHLGADERPDITLEKPGDVWKHVRLGFEMMVHRRDDGDAEDGVYFSLECNCDWEPEHGMQLVIRDGRAVTKVSDYNGHLTNADAYDDRKLVGVVYKPM